MWAPFHLIRRSHASHLTVVGGDARQSLGHSSEAVTDKSYRDPRITNRGLSRAICYSIRFRGGVGCSFAFGVRKQSE